MNKMHSPWRSRYIASFKDEQPRKGESLFTRILRERKDTRNLVVQRKQHCFVMMNLYPYNSGHLMIVPYTQTPTLSGLDSATLTEIMETLKEMQEVLTALLNPHGFNIGANIGRVAGAGIDDHIHFHLVPRWNGDTNFMPTLGDVKVVSDDMKKTYKEIIAYLKRSKSSRRP